MINIKRKTAELIERRAKDLAKKRDLTAYKKEAQQLLDRLYLWVENNTDWDAQPPFQGVAWTKEVDLLKVALRRLID